MSTTTVTGGGVKRNASAAAAAAQPSAKRDKPDGDFFGHAQAGAPNSAAITGIVGKMPVDAHPVRQPQNANGGGGGGAFFGHLPAPLPGAMITTAPAGKPNVDAPQPDDAPAKPTPVAPAPPAVSAAAPLMEMLLTSTTAIKATLEALKDVLADVNMRFTDAGMRIIAVNPAKTALVHLRLDADKMDKYACREPHSVGINVPQLHRNIRSAAPDSAIKFTSLVENGAVMFRIQMEHAKTRRSMIIDMNTKDIEDDGSMDMERGEYVHIVNLETRDLVDSLREMAPCTEDFIGFVVYRDRIELTGENETAGQAARLTLVCDGDSHRCISNGGAAAPTAAGADDPSAAATDGALSIHLALRYVQAFAKALPSLSDTVTLYLHATLPFVMEVKAYDLGSIHLAVAPRNDEDDDDGGGNEDGGGMMAAASGGGGSATDAPGSAYRPE